MAELNTMTINGLVKKRAELAGQIVEAERKLSALRGDLSHVDAAIRIFDPDYKLESIKAKTPRQPLAFNRGELIRDVLDILRTADKPMSVAELASGLMGWTPLDGIFVPRWRCEQPPTGGGVRGRS